MRAPLGWVHDVGFTIQRHVTNAWQFAWCLQVGGQHESYNQASAHPREEHFMHLRCDNVAKLLSFVCGCLWCLQVGGQHESYKQASAHPCEEHFMHLRCDNVVKLLSFVCGSQWQSVSFFFMLCVRVLWIGPWTATIKISTVWTTFGDCHRSHNPHPLF